jgi:hypothetical protein
MCSFETHVKPVCSVMRRRGFESILLFTTSAIRRHKQMAVIHRSQPGTSGTTKLNHQTNEAWFPVPQRQLNIAPPLDPAACLHARCLVFESSVAFVRRDGSLKTHYAFTIYIHQLDATLF